jgi:ATP-binding cassette subfamily B protein
MLAPSPAGFRRLLPLLQPYHRQLWAGGVCTLVFVGCWPVLAWLGGQLVPAIGSGDVAKVLQVVTLALGVFMLQKMAQFGQDTLLAGPALQVSQDLRRRLFARLQRLEFGALEKLSAGDLTYRLTEDADRVGEVIYKTIQDTIPCLLQLVVVFGYMVWLDWRLSLGTLVLAPLVAVLVSLFGARVMGAAERSQKQVSELASLLGEAIGGLPLVRAFAAEPWLQARFETEIDLHRQARFRTQRLLALQYPVVGFLEAAGILAVLLMGAARIQSNELTSAGFSSYVAALLMLIDPISHLTTNFNEFQQGQASLRRLRAIEAEPIEPPDRADAQALGAVKGELVLDQVVYGYDPQKPVLHGLTLRIQPGQVVALVGPSGADRKSVV